MELQQIAALTILELFLTHLNTGIQFFVAALEWNIFLPNSFDGIILNGVEPCEESSKLNMPTILSEQDKFSDWLW